MHETKHKEYTNRTFLDLINLICSLTIIILVCTRIPFSIVCLGMWDALDTVLTLSIWGEQCTHTQNAI